MLLQEVNCASKFMIHYSCCLSDCLSTSCTERHRTTEIVGCLLFFNLCLWNAGVHNSASLQIIIKKKIHMSLRTFCRQLGHILSTSSTSSVCSCVTIWMVQPLGISQHTAPQSLQLSQDIIFVLPPDDPIRPGWPLWRTIYLCTTSPLRMLSKWLWISRCGDYWQQAELRTDGACRIMMMMMMPPVISLCPRSC